MAARRRVAGVPIEQRLLETVAWSAVLLADDLRRRGGRRERPLLPGLGARQALLTVPARRFMVRATIWRGPAMGMRSGKALKAKKVVAKRAVKAPARRPVAKAAKPAAPKVVTRTVTKTVTKTTDRNAALRGLAQRIVDATVANDEAAMFALYDPRVESQEANNPPSVGLAALREKFANFAQMITDGVFLPRSVVADGKTIMIEWDGRMTLAASGRLVEMREVAVHEIENGKIVRERFYYDPAVLAP